MYFQLNSQISDLFFDLCYCFLLLLCLFGIFCSIFVKTTFFSSCSLSIQYDFYIIYSTTYLRVARQRSHLLSKSSKFVFVWYVVAFLICCWLLFKILNEIHFLRQGCLFFCFSLLYIANVAHI